MEPLLARSRTKWNHDDVVALARRLYCCGSINCTGGAEDAQGTSISLNTSASPLVHVGVNAVNVPAGFWAMQSVAEDLETYAAQHKDIQELLDPIYIMFVHPLHERFAKAVAGYPTDNSPVLAPRLFNAAIPHVYHFPANHAGFGDARQFLGHVQALCPGQRAIFFRTSTAAGVL